MNRIKLLSLFCRTYLEIIFSRIDTKFITKTKQNELCTYFSKCKLINLKKYK